MIWWTLALAAEPAAPFDTVYAVLTHPRCANCHPVDDVPTVGDEMRPHAMSVDRKNPDLGVPCSTCHRPTPIDIPGGPPGAEHWHLPPMNQAFQKRSPYALCEQLKDPTRTGGRDLAALVEHVKNDALVKYGWNPGGGRTTPPVSHADFVTAFEAWTAGGAECPEGEPLETLASLLGVGLVGEGEPGARLVASLAAGKRLVHADQAAEWSELADGLKPLLGEAATVLDQAKPDAENFATLEALAPKLRNAGVLIWGVDAGGEDFLLTTSNVADEAAIRAAATEASVKIDVVGE